MCLAHTTPPYPTAVGSLGVCKIVTGSFGTVASRIITISEALSEAFLSKSEFMTIPTQLVYDGQNKEFQFRDSFVMPLIRRLGFGIVANNHGPREFGRDVIFGDIDRFGAAIYYGMQIKYESSISLSDSHSLAQDAEQATHNPFTHPQTGKKEFISCFYVANAGGISEQARENFFNIISRRSVRDARLLDGNALVLLDKSASLSRNSHILERLTGLIQEVRRNRNVTAKLSKDLQSFAQNPDKEPYPLQRCRNSATGAYLNAPFSIPNLDVGVVDQYWETVRMINDVSDSVGSPIVGIEFRKSRANGLNVLRPQLEDLAIVVEKTSIALVDDLSGENIK